MLSWNAQRPTSPVTGQWIRRRSFIVVFAVLALASLGVAPAAFAGDGHDNDRDQPWVATWGASPVAPLPTNLTNPGFTNQTVRLIVHTSIAGDDVRVRLSNAFGANSLVIGA